MRKITRANYHSITCFNVGKRVAMKEEAAAAAEGEDGGAERCGVSQMEVISPRGGQTAAMALAGSRDGPQRFMDTQVTRHEQCGHVFEDFLSFFFLFSPISVHGYCRLQVDEILTVTLQVGYADSKVSGPWSCQNG